LLVADWAKERKLRMLPSDCFETGGRSLTQSSVERDRGSNSKWTNCDKPTSHYALEENRAYYVRL
jgi:hypothetical protein